MGDAFFLNAISTPAPATGLTAITWRGTKAGGDSKIDCHYHRAQLVCIRLDVATQNLDGFQVEGTSGPDDTNWLVLASAAGDFSGATQKPFITSCGVYTTSSGAYSDADPTTAAAGESILLVLNTLGLTGIRIKVSGAVNNAVVTGFATGLANPAGGSGNVVLQAGDIEIGAVELKNGTTDDRAAISSAGALKIEGGGTAGSAAAAVVTVQGIASGTTLPVTEASASGIATAVKNRDLVPLGTAQFSCPTTANGVALATLYGASLPAGVLAVSIIPKTSTEQLYWNHNGNASAATAPWPKPGAERRPVSTAQLDSARWISGEAGAVVGEIVLWGVRN